MAAYRGRNDIALTNVIGSNIINTLGIAGVASMIREIKVDPQMAHLDSWVMLGATLLIFPLIWICKDKINRLAGGLLLATYVGYLFYVFYR